MNSSHTTPVLSRILASVLLGISIGSSAYAATTGTVTATVTAQNVSLTVSPGSVAYGIMAANASRSTIAADVNAAQTVTNTGNVQEDFSVKGQDSADWTLNSTAGTDQYVHKFCSSTCGTPPTNYTALTTSYQALSSDVAVSGTSTLNLQLTTPNPSTVYTQQQADVTVLAVAG